MISEKLDTLASEIGQLLKEHKQTISVAESTTGGLISAALLSQPGASEYYCGGSVVYTRASRKAFLDINKSKLDGVKPLTQEMALIFAEAAQDKLSATWGLAELGASGPSDSPYGHPAGSSVIAFAGPLQRSILVQTGHNDRQRNMVDFSEAALSLAIEAIQAQTDQRS